MDDDGPFVPDFRLELRVEVDFDGDFDLDGDFRFDEEFDLDEAFDFDGDFGFDGDFEDRRLTIATSAMGAPSLAVIRVVFAFDGVLRDRVAPCLDFVWLPAIAMGVPR